MSASPAAPTSTAMFSAGPITGFGSVHLNGMTFETTSASISVDGKSAVQGDLRAGHVIEVKGHHDAGRNLDIADEIDFRGNTEGPVSSIDLTAQTLVVLGQTVVISPDTSFDDDINPASLAGISVGDNLEVSGMAASDGKVHATRIERKPAGTGFQVIGIAASTDPVAKTLMINALLVNFSTAALAEFPSTGPKDGDLVEATGTTLDSSGALVATRLELRTGKGLKADADAASQIEGLITRFASATDFDVAGRPVTTTMTTSFEGGNAADLALNLRVEVQGAVNSSGLLTATRIQIGHPADTRLRAQLDSVDATAGTLVVLGISISVDGMTRLDDHGPQKLDTFSLSSLHSGDWVEVRGRAAAAGGLTLTATRIERRQPQAGVELRGTVLSAAAPAFSILSATIATTSTTQFKDGLDAATFFAAPVGRAVTVKGSWNGTTLIAASLQLRDDDDD